MKLQKNPKVGTFWSAAVLTMLAVGVGGQIAFAQSVRRQLVQPLTQHSLTNRAVVSKPLSTTVQKQLALIAKDKASWSPIQKKLSSNLIRATRLDTGRSAVPGVTTLRAPKLERDMLGRVLVDIRGKITPALQQAIEEMGGMVVNAQPRWNAMRAWMGTAWLESLASRSDIRQVRAAIKPFRNSGSVTSQGDITHGANLARSNYSAGGGSSKIGVISDSVDFLADSEASGDLPTGIEILADAPGSSGEGTAMLEIIHDLAPDAGLAFATGFDGAAATAQYILDLAGAGCDIIVDDVGYVDEGAFQDDLVAQAIDEVTSKGVLYFSAAGNQRLSAWEGDFVDGGPASGVLAGAGKVHKFPSGRLFNSQDFSSNVVLNWTDPLQAATNDYDLYILDESGSEIIDLSNSAQGDPTDPFGDPLESTFTFPDEQIVTVLFAGKARGLRLYTPPAGFLSESTSGETVGHAGARGAFGVAAVDANLSFPNLFSSLSLHTESFSSTGPRRVFFEGDGTPITPGNILFKTNGGEVRNKPDFTAADGVATTLGDPNLNPFYGTSAAAPHAAAIAAQVRSLFVDKTTATSKSFVDGVSLPREEIASALANTALDIEAAGWDNKAGSGLLLSNKVADSLVHFIGNLKVTPSTDRVTFTWTTSVPASSTIEVFTGPNDPDPKHIDDPVLRTSHSVTVTSLKLDVAYKYSIESGSTSGMVYEKVSSTFKTFFIDDIVITGVTANQATISWRTGIPANSKLVVARSATDPKPIIINDAALVTDHSFTVTGLEEETLYQVTASSKAPSGLSGEKKATFRTAALQELIVVKAVLLNKNGNPWKLEVTLKNRSKFTTLRNFKIDAMILNAANTITKMPFIMPNVLPDSTVTQVFLYNKLKLQGALSARVTGTYQASRAGSTPKRFSAVVPVQIL